MQTNDPLRLNSKEHPLNRMLVLLSLPNFKSENYILPPEIPLLFQLYYSHIFSALELTCQIPTHLEII